VEGAPQADRAERLPGREAIVREVAAQFIRREVHIREDHQPGLGLLKHLRSPSRLRPGVKALAAGEAELSNTRSAARNARASCGRCDDRDWPSRGPIHPAGPFAPGQRGCGAAKFALGGEEEVGGPIDAQ